MLTSLPKGQLFITDSQLNHLSIISIIMYIYLHCSGNLNKNL